MNITGSTIEKLEDPTGILEGDRYEYFIDIEVPEDDELYSENGIYLKVIFVVEENGARIAQYHLYEKTTDKYIDFSLEEEEEAMVLDYCKQHIDG